ncbi:1-phosphatidylinositol 4,5-bisphosphate phosphodiesterase [Hondaea fermentalgiana]|uniref:Phosphoinositide phospholipase C n=1 Tax=Hondaea fermentalgiana TaxID=2315210 RepID=A0A2R5GRB1_9STRA|nr:1-phosphatidylinositol 4,5-bisphosphate phosphodiesterase [Hondaea fermentalgiana]|eukprot:GBG32298.1 1-phosphatidylinositol 4,5-bisphosphate phosphodiesterase [Hondaea fermentalgiana]
MLRDFYGFSEDNISLKDVARVYMDVSYNPSIGAIFAALIKERDQLTETIWNEFQTDFQGTPLSQIASITQVVRDYSDLEGPPVTASQFEEFLLSPANSAFDPRLDALRRFDRPLSEYFVQVAKIQDCDTMSAEDMIKRYASCIRRGARVVELECSGGASDGEPRVFADTRAEDLPLDTLPTLLDTLKAIVAEMNEVDGLGSASKSPKDLTCMATGTKINAMPLLVIVTVQRSCDETMQRRISTQLREVFGSKMDKLPLNDNGSIWSPIQLDSRVLVIMSQTMVGNLDAEGNLTPGPPLVSELSDIAHLRMVTVHEIRPILDQAKSRKDLRRLLQGLVLTLASVELCAHIMELSSITDMLLIHVQTSKRTILQKKEGNLLQRDDDQGRDQDTRHVVQFSELRPGETSQLIMKEESLTEVQNDEVEPLRGWRYGAQIVPVHTFGHEEASLQHASLFCQHGSCGFVPRMPREAFEDVTGFIDLYDDFCNEYARSLFVTVLSACRVPRAQELTQPYLRMYCNNGTGLKQVAITSTVEDNGYNLIWEEDFEFKFHINDLNSAACILFALHDRNQLGMETFAWASIPLWGLQTGYRRVQIFDLDHKPVPGAILFLHFDWEPEE